MSALAASSVNSGPVGRVMAWIVSFAKHVWDSSGLCPLFLNHNQLLAAQAQLPDVQMPRQSAQLGSAGLPSPL